MTRDKYKAQLQKLKDRLDALADKAVTGEVLANELYQILSTVVWLMLMEVEK